MKALEILKDLLINMNALDDDGYHFGKYATQEAINELEALQQPKQCNTCSFYHSFTGVCANDKCPLCADFVDADFGCIYHEVKE